MAWVKLSHETYLRQGGARSGPDNRVMPVALPAHTEYEAIAQCTGQYVRNPEPGVVGSNHWWVLIDTNSHGRGWVSAIHVEGGLTDQRILGVSERPVIMATQEWTPSLLAHQPYVEVYRSTPLRTGGSINADPDTKIMDLDPGSFQALEQRCGRDVTHDPDFNFWWVLVETPTGERGWITAVDITIGGNNQPIPLQGVDQFPTVYLA